MTHSHIEHPSEETLAAFVEGRLSDPSSVETHVDGCEECARIVLGVERIELMSSLGLIPALTAEQLAANRELLKQLLQKSHHDVAGECVTDETTRTEVTAVEHPVVRQAIDGVNTELSTSDQLTKAQSKAMPASQKVGFTGREEQRRADQDVSTSSLPPH